MDAYVGRPRPAFGMSEGPVACVEVSVDAFVQNDEVVMVVGSCKAFGNWNVLNALVLHPKSGNEWALSEVHVPCGCEVKFRIVVACRHTRNPLRWEAGQPRSIVLQAESTRVEAQFGMPAPGSLDLWVDSGAVMTRHEVLLTLGPTNPVELRPIGQEATHLVFSSLDPRCDKVSLPLPLSRTQPLVSVWSATADALGLRVQLMCGDRLLGGAVVLPGELEPRFGALSRPLLTPDFEVLGSFSGTFATVHPFVHKRNTLAHTRPSDPAVPRVVGHRGTGVSGADKPSPSRILENTVTAFNVAARRGVQYVEFDVQPTRDGVPVIYHDFWIENKQRAALICEMTIEEFKSLHQLGACTSQPQPTPVRTAAAPKPAPPVRSYSACRRRPTIDEFVRDTTPAPPAAAGAASAAPVSPAGAAPASPAGAAPPTPLSVKEARKMKKPQTFKIHNPLAVREPYPTLQQLYTKVDPRLGFNVEIKYPDGHLTQKRLRTYGERNAFLDQVLQVTFEYAGDRPLYFSSFDPDVVWLLRRKQSRYPVFFLTEGTPISKRIDPRSHSLSAAVEYAAEAGLTGVVTDVRALLQHPDQVAAAHAHGLRFATYGEGNNDPATCDKQLELGVDVIIADKVSRVVQHVSARVAAASQVAPPAA